MRFMMLLSLFIFSVNAYCGNSHGMERRSARIVPFEPAEPEDLTVLENENDLDPSEDSIEMTPPAVVRVGDDESHWSDIEDADIADEKMAAQMNTRMLIVVDTPTPPNNEPIEIFETPLRVIGVERVLPFPRTPIHRPRVVNRRTLEEPVTEHGPQRRAFTFTRQPNAVDAPATHFIQFEPVPYGHEVNMNRFTIQPIRRSLEMEFNRAASQ